MQLVVLIPHKDSWHAQGCGFKQVFHVVVVVVVGVEKQERGAMVLYLCSCCPGSDWSKRMADIMRGAARVGYDTKPYLALPSF